MVEHKDNDGWGLSLTTKLQTWTYLNKECCAVFEAVVDLSQRVPCEFPQNLAEILIDVWVVH